MPKMKVINVSAKGTPVIIGDVVTNIYVERKCLRNPEIPEPGYYYGRRLGWSGDPVPLWITGGHRVKTNSGFESFQAFEWFGPVIPCKALGDDQ